METRELEPERDSFFFDAGDPTSPEDRARIRPLKLETARSVRDEQVSNSWREDHPMLLPEGHWIRSLAAIGPDWQQIWPRRSNPDAVVDFLRSQIDWLEDVEVIFVWNREYAVSTPCGVFLRNWRDFLFESVAHDRNRDDSECLVTGLIPAFGASVIVTL